MNRLCKLITWPIAIIFLFQNISWTAPVHQPSTINYKLSAIFIPAQYGSVEKSQVSRPTPRVGTPQSQVILIKDAHCNYEAQTNIAKILDILIRDYKIDLVCVEGAEGVVDTGPYNTFPDQTARDRVTDKYIKKGILSASEALSISKGNKQPFTIWGVEDSRLYLSDFKAFRETLTENTEYIEFLSQAFKSINLLKNKIYNKRLLNFDNRFKEYNDNRMSFSNWISYIRTFIPGLGHNKNIVYAVKSIRLEDETDFKKVEDERAGLIKELEKSLTKEDLQELVRQSLLFKLGKIPAVQYYSYLERYLSNVPRDLTLNLKKYIRSVHIQALIDSDGLFNELYLLESQIYSNLCKDEIERKLHRIDTNLTILNKLLNLQMSRQDLSYYKEHINEFDPKEIAEFINIQCKNNNISSTLPSPVDKRESAERFYELAIERDNVLVNNLLTQMEKAKKQNAALVIGGFHAEGIIKQLEDRGFSYVVISPKITSVQGDNPYLSIMLDEKIDIDKLVENISGTTLAPRLSLGNMGDTEVRRRLAKGLIEYRNRPLKDLLAKYTGSDADAIRELCRMADMGLAEMAVEERKVGEFITPQLLTDQIITADNPAFAAFLLDLLIAQISEKPQEVEEGIYKIIAESNILEIRNMALDYILSQENITYRRQIIKPILQGSDLGKYLSPEVMDSLSANPDVQINVFSEGQDVVTEGDPSDSIYLVVSGQLEVSTEALGTIAALQDNTIFGEIGVLTNQVRTATVKVKGSRAILLRIGKNTAGELKGELEGFARKRLIDQIERLKPRSIIVPIRDLKELSLQELETLRWQMERSTQAIQNRPVVSARLGEWKTKLDRLTKEEAEEYNKFMREIGNYLMASGMPEENVIKFLEQLDNLILAQDIVSEQFAYIPINARHVLNTARNIINILGHPNFSQRRELLELKYGKERLLPALLFLALSSQAGYRIVEVGKPETFNRYKELGSKMIRDTFGEAIRRYLGQETLDDILDAVERQGIRKEGMLTSDNPLLFMLTIAQWMDISSRRLTEWQKNPFFIQILSKVNVNSYYIQMKRNLEKAHRENSPEFARLKADLRNLIYNLSSEELEKLRGKKLVPDDEYKQIKRALRSIDLEGLDFFLGTAMIEDIQIDFDTEGILVVNVYAVDKALEYGSFANTDFYVNLVVERMQRYISSITMEGIKVNITSSELHVELGEFIERLPMAELHSHLNGAIEFNRQWQELIRLHLAKQAKDWNNVKGKNINAKLRDLYKDEKIDLNDIFGAAMTTRIFLIMVLKERGEAVSDETSDLELLPLVDKHIKMEEDPEHSDLFIMLRHYVNTRNQFRSFIEYLPIEAGKLPEFVMHFAVGSGVGKAGDRGRELTHLENNAHHLARSSYRANGYYYEYRINLGKTREETRKEVEAIIRGIARAEEEIARGLRAGEPGFEGRIVLSFGRMGNSPEEYSQQAREFVAMLREDPGLLERIVGIDVANQEEETPPEAFSEAFKIIEAYNKTLSEEMRLQMTYHVGEGFTDVSLETSLRFVGEVINHGASRLGHAIVLGIDPSQFTQEPRTELVSERIKTLNWIRGLSKELALGYFTIEYIDNELSRLTGETVSVSYNDAARRDIERIQDYLLTKVIEREIVIETNPTSNSQIVTGNNMKNHPLRKFLTFTHPVTGQRVRFTINTDDAGVFGTDLRREYLRAAKAFGFSVRQLWEIASQGFRAHMGRPLRYQSQIEARLGQIQAQTMQPTAVSAAVGTKSHKAGIPKIAGRDAVNADVDYIIDGLFRQDRIRGGFQADPAEPIVNEITGQPINFTDDEERYFEGAFKVIQMSENMDRILAVIEPAKKSGLLNIQLSKLKAERQEIQGQGKDTAAIDEHIKLLEDFINNPLNTLNERLGFVYVLILGGLDFLVFNDNSNYWVGHSSTSRNAIYLPERIYMEIRHSPQALAAFLMDELVDAIVGEHTSLSDDLIRLLDPKGILTDSIKKKADSNNKEATGLAEKIAELVNKNLILEAVVVLEDALGVTISPSTLPLVLEMAIEKIKSEYASTFSFLISGSQKIRDTIYNLIREDIIDLDLAHGFYSPLAMVVYFIYKPVLTPDDKWLPLVQQIITNLSGDNAAAMADWVEDYFRRFSDDPEKIKRYLAVLLLELSPIQDFRDFIYRVLALPIVRESYPPGEYMELAIQTISKLEGLHAEQIKKALKMLARLGGYTGEEKLLERYKPYFDFFGLDVNMISDYFSTQTEPIIKPEQVDTGAYPEQKLKEAGYDMADDFKSELLLLFNNTDILGNRLSPEELRDSVIEVSHIDISAHTLVSLVKVRIGKTVHLFVHKKTFAYFHTSMLSDVFNLYQSLDPQTAKHTLPEQYGEWITPFSKDGRLMGYHRLEEYLPGFSIYDSHKLFGPDSKEYRLATALAVAAYYNLFINVAGGRWFLGDPTPDNARLALIDDGRITAKIVDIEARIELPEIPDELKEGYFKTWLRNQGFSGDLIEEGINLAKAGYFNMSSYDSEEAANLIRFAQERLSTTMGEELPQIAIAGIEGPTMVRDTIVDRTHTDTTLIPQAGLAHLEGKVIAIGDVHGELVGLKEILKEAELIDEDGHWAGGNASLVQLGDIVDRGPDSIGTFKFLLQLQEEAEQAGGRVIILLGNHEWAYLTEEGASGMRYLDVLIKAQRGEATTKEVNDARREYYEIRRLIIDAVSNGQIQAAHTVGNTVFVHAGIRPVIYEFLRNEIAAQEITSVDNVTIDDITDHCNRILIEAVTKKDYTHPIFNVGADREGEADDAGIFWARLNDKAEELPGIRQVVGHSKRNKITKLAARGIIGIDVGISRRAYLEITPEGRDRVIRGVTKGDTGTWHGLVITRTAVQPAGLAHFEELAVIEDTARGTLSVVDIPGMGGDEQENARKIKNFIQEKGKEIETKLGITTKIWGDPDLNNLLLENLNRLLESLPEEERSSFLTVLKANAPPEGLVLAILDKSQHLGENCQGDGFIGVNRYLLQKLKDATDQPTIDALSNLLQVILYHELRHEALIFEKEVEKAGISPEDPRFKAEVESRQNLHDIELLDVKNIDILIKLGLIKPDSYFGSFSPSGYKLEFNLDFTSVIPLISARIIDEKGLRSRLERNMFYHSATDEMKEKIVGRIKELAPAVSFIRKSLEGEDIINISVFGSYVFGHEDIPSSNLDVVMVVKGNRFEHREFPFDTSKMRRRFNKISVRIVGEENLVRGIMPKGILEGGLTHPAEIIITIDILISYWRNIVLWGRDFQEIKTDNRNYLISIAELLQNAYKRLYSTESKEDDETRLRKTVSRLYNASVLMKQLGLSLDLDISSFYEKYFLGITQKDAEDLYWIITRQFQKEFIRATKTEAVILNRLVDDIAQILKKYDIDIEDTQRKTLAERLKDAYEGKIVIDLVNLVELLARKIEPERIFQLTAEIAEPINRFLGPKGAVKGGQMVAAVLQEILELIPEERRIEVETEEDKLLKTIQALASEKGIDPNAMRSVFDLFKAGLEILAVDPSYKLDSNYFVLISQIEKLTGIDDKKIIEVFSRRGLAKEKAEPVPNSPLAQEVEKLGLYLELSNMSIRPDLDLGLEQRRGLFYLDNLNAKIEKNGDIQFLSSVDAVNKDMAMAYSGIQLSPGGNIIDRTEKITLVVSADTLMSVERDGKFLRFSYKPGIQALLRILANSKNIHIVIRAGREARQALEEIGILNEQVTVEDTKKELNKIRTDAALSDWAKDEDHVVFLLTPEEGDVIDTKGMKAFGIDPTAAFHAALLFAVTYAQAQTIDEIEIAINSLKLLGMEPSEVDEIVRKIKEEGLGFFTVRLIRIEETLKEFQNRRLYIEVAA